jgi:hypothetical protein
MLYNDLITYNQQNITYIGTIQINVPGLSNPIIVGDITVVISVEEDFSNMTTIGFITYDFTPSGIMSFEATEDQAYAISQSSTVYISPTGEVAIENV